MRILAIETSCDDTAAAVVDSDLRVLASVVSSQNEIHARFGGIVPAGAVAVAANLTQTGTVGVGYLAVAPGRASGPPPTSAINWTGDQTLANGMLLKSGATPEVSVYAGPSSQGVGANYIMDVSGYFI